MEQQEYFTPDEMHHMKHALGLSRKKLSYRNHYHDNNNVVFEGLVKRGLAWKREVIGLSVYHVTDEGKALMKQYIGNFKEID